MPRTPQEQMAMAPEVFKFTREFGRGQQIEEKPSVIQQIAGTLGNVALAGAGIAGAYGLARALSPETDISPVSTGATSDVGEPKPKGQRNPVYTHPHYGKAGREMDVSKISSLYDAVAAHDFESPTDDVFVEPYVRTTVRREDPVPTPKKQRTTVLPEGNYGNEEIDPAIEAKYSIARNEAPLHLANRFEKMAYIGEDQANAAYEQAGLAALDQAFEDAVGRDDYHEERFGIQGSPQASAIAEGPETVIEPTKSTTGFLDAFSKEVQDFDHNIPWGERTEEALDSDSALGAAGIMASTVAEKGIKDIGTRAKKIVQQVPKTVEKVKEGIQEAANVITHEQIKASTFAEAARISAGLPPLLGSDVVEVGIESDLSDNAQFDDPHQTNEQISPAGLNRQDTTQTVVDLANTLSKGLAHLSPEDRMDLARKMIDEGYNS